MEHILNFLSIPFEPTMEVKISNWLSHGHYIHAIDYERNCVLVFNIPHKAIAQLISLGLCDYDDFSYKNHPNPPKHYVKLFRYVDWFLFENIGAYRWFAQRQDYRAFSTISERYAILDAAYFHDGYSAWRVRYYLSRNLMGLNAKNPRRCFHYDDDNVDLALICKAILPQLVEAEKKLEVPATFRYPIDLEVWLDHDRLYIGWFVNDLYVYTFRGLFEKLGIVTNEMNLWFERNGYPRNTRDQSEIDRFLARLRQNNIKD